MRKKIVETGTISSLIRVLESLSARGAGEEGMALFYGPPGAGKTTALAYAQLRTQATMLRARSTWSITSMLGQLLRELGLSETGSRDTRLDRIVEHLLMHPRPILIDEVDYALRRPDLLDVFRDVYDLSKVPVVFVGMQDAPRILRSHPRLLRHRRRVARWVEAAPLALDEMKRVAEELCEVAVGERLLGRLHKESRGNMGLAVVGLGVIERVGKSNDAPRVSESMMQDVSLVGG